MKIFTTKFEGIYPVGNCLIIAANNEKEALDIARNTIKHTTEIDVIEVDISNPTVIKYLSGDY